MSSPVPLRSCVYIYIYIYIYIYSHFGSNQVGWWQILASWREKTHQASRVSALAKVWPSTDKKTQMIPWAIIAALALILGMQGVSGKPLLLVAEYNPMSLVKPGRQAHIANELKRVSVLFQPGTRIRAPLSTPHGAVSAESKTHTTWDWGYGAFAKMSNRATGVRIQFRKDLFKEKHHVQTWSPPQQLQGRGGAVRMAHGRADITSMITYFPPKPQLAVEQKHYENTVKALYKWVKTTILSVRAKHKRSLLLLGGDFNDQVRMNEGGLVGELMRELAELAQITPVNSAAKAGHTYYGENHTSEVDFVYVQNEVLHTVKKIYIAASLTKKVQMVDRKKQHDHMIVMLEIEYILEFKK